MPEREIDLQGPPGAGKTRTLIQLSQAAAVQFGPRSLGVCTFTRAAADAAADAANAADAADAAARAKIIESVLQLLDRLIAVTEPTSAHA